MARNDEAETDGSDSTTDGLPVGRRSLLAAGAMGLGLAGAGQTAASSSDDEDGDNTENSPFAVKEHDHSGEYGAATRLGEHAPVESIVADRVHSREVPHADVTAYGAEGDGETDDTAAIQATIDAAGAADDVGTVFFPAGTYMIDPTTLDPIRYNPAGLELHSDLELVFAEGATIKNLPHDTDGYNMLRINGVENVTIAGGTLDGSREDNAVDGGQHGMCIDLRHSENVTITDTTVKNAWGDGIYVGGRGPSHQQGGPLVNRNIHLNRIHADNNRRQGISLVSAKDFWLTDSLLENTSGTLPAAGLDIETHRSDEIVDNINISNLETANNRLGIQIWLNGYEQPTPQNETKIYIDGHHDRGSEFGFRAGTPSQNIPGEVRVSNPRWEKNGYRAFSIPHWDTLPLIVDDPTAIDVLGSEAFYFQLWSHRDLPGGNIEINRPRVTTGDAGAKPETAIWHRHLADYTNFTLRNPRELAATDTKVAWNPDATIEDFTLVDDENEVLRGSPDEDQRVKGWNTLSTIDSREFTADRELYLPADDAPHGDYIFESHSDEHRMIVVPPSDEAIYPISGSEGTSVVSGGDGARLRLRKVADGRWMAINQIGTWHDGADVAHPDNPDTQPSYWVLLGNNGDRYTRAKSPADYPIETDDFVADSGIYTELGDETENNRYNQVEIQAITEYDGSGSEPEVTYGDSHSFDEATSTSSTSAYQGIRVEPTERLEGLRIRLDPASSDISHAAIFDTDGNIVAERDVSDAEPGDYVDIPHPDGLGPAEE